MTHIPTSIPIPSGSLPTSKPAVANRHGSEPQDGPAPTIDLGVGSHLYVLANAHGDLETTNTAYTHRVCVVAFLNRDTAEEEAGELSKIAGEHIEVHAVRVVK